MIVRGARQVGKTSFIIKTLKNFEGYQKVFLNCASKGKSTIDGIEYFGRDFFGSSEDASQFFYNLSLTIGDLGKRDCPILIFIDEADRFPISLEAIQTIAGRSDTMKVVYTGSNLENIRVNNAATGRKQYFDLYPITFMDFLGAYGKENELRYVEEMSLRKPVFSEMFHNELNRLFDLYLRLGGMPRIMDAFIDVTARTQPIPQLISDLVSTIEDNVKMVLNEKARLYEYEDVLRRLALLSMDTLKISKLQVQHAGRREAKMLVNKTVGARVAHKIRLFEAATDISKYILFDVGVLNYLLNGADLLGNKIAEDHMAIQYETAIGNEIIARLISREDLMYWKSPRGAQVEYVLKSPHFAAIDVKSSRGDVRSLDSCAIYEKELECIIKISKEPARLVADHVAKIPALGLSRKVPLVTIPHFASGRLAEILDEL